MCLTRKRRLKYDISYGRVLHLKRYKTYGYRHARVKVFVVDSHDKHGRVAGKTLRVRLETRSYWPIRSVRPGMYARMHVASFAVFRNERVRSEFSGKLAESRRQTRYVHPGTDWQNCFGLGKSIRATLWSLNIIYTYIYIRVTIFKIKKIKVKFFFLLPE